MIRLLDDFEDVSGWLPVTSGLAELEISRDRGCRGAALRLEFDFKGGGGFVVARKAFSLPLPESFAISFGIRGSAPPNRFELKLVDPPGRNVWWYRCNDFQPPAQWRRVRVRSAEIEFAWGPAGGGSPTDLGAIEVAIAAGAGGRGTIWIESLEFEDTSVTSVPAVSASSFLAGHEPQAALDGSLATSWRSEPSGGPQWLQIDFQQPREYGGLVIDWEFDGGAAAFDVEVSDDGNRWRTVHSSHRPGRRRSYVYLPGCVSRYLRLHLRPRPERRAVGIAAIDVRPHDFSRSLNSFFTAVATRERKGTYPRYLRGEQSYWTCTGLDGRAAPALMNEEGLVEVRRGGWSVEPYLHAGGELVTWADAEVTVGLVGGDLPLPWSRWRKGELELCITAFSCEASGPPALRLHYRVRNAGRASRQVRLFVAVRPFQVTPPWQAFGDLGGVSPIREMRHAEGVVWVNGHVGVVALSRPAGFGALAFEEGGIVDFLGAGSLPPATHVVDDFGHAAGALAFDVDLEAGGERDVYLAVPFEPGEHDCSGLLRSSAAAGGGLEAVARRWRRRLDASEFLVPESARRYTEVLRTATAHILVNRDGVALQPGPRRYARSWIRDAATMGAALLRAGFTSEVREFIGWYAAHQAADGNVPCCVDAKGPDWLAEHDSHGQLIYLIAEHARFSGDIEFAGEMWPVVLKAVDYLEALRQQRLDPGIRHGNRRACYGLLPESVSHEGYLSQPVHSYWDDFWGLRGLSDALWLARRLESPQVERLVALRDSFRETLYASIETTIADRHLPYVPGSVEWADFDPTATAAAIATTDAGERLPAAALAYTYDEYLRGFRRRRDGELDWNNYTPYEIRNIGALVRLGRRREAHELIQHFLEDCRPRPWNQWPEIAWRDPRSPGHLGDVPHAWIGAEYVLAVLALFAYEREPEPALVLAAGIPGEWLDGGGEVGVDRLPTYYGPVTYSLRRVDDDVLRFELGGGIEIPRGGLILAPPLPRPLRAVDVNGKRATSFDAASATLRCCPAAVELRF